MLDLNVIRRNPELLRESVVRRGLDPARADVDRFLELDVGRREIQTRRDGLRHEQGDLGKEIKSAPKDEKAALVERVRALKAEIAALDQEQKVVEEAWGEVWSALPNFLAEDVPEGKTDEQNLEISRWGEPRELGFEPRDHVELGRLTDTIDFERAGKVTGASFYYLKHEAALLEQALMAYAASVLVPEGFVPMATPTLARDEVLAGIGFQPRGHETQIYSVEGSDLSLIGTAEITLGGYHREEILEGDALPLTYLGFSRCFRTEAGAHGRESRGLYRVHEFTKAEMFVICRPEESPKWHETMRELEERLFQGLGVPYRVVSVCAGDLGAPAAKKYDIEAWMPGRGRFGEVTSCSNCTDYQARRLGVRFRPDKGAKAMHPHMLNGTAIAVSRGLIAIMENYQREDGSIEIPEVLRPFACGITEIPRRLAE
jgi:seryl-tRNA synthetase